MMRVSVLITNYDYARFLRAAIDSALAQERPETEVVVVDDGSTDESREIIRGYGDRVTAVFKPNGGQASAFNAGFEACRGELVMLLDADDLLAPGAASAVVAAWRPGVARVQFRLEVVDGDGRALGGRIPREPMPSGDVRHLVLASGRYPGTGTTGTAYHRAVLERLLPIPEEQWRKQPDAFLLLLAPFCGEIAPVDRILGAYRWHGSNNWASTDLGSVAMHERLEYDRRKAALLRRRLPEFGVDLPDGWCLRSRQHLQRRIASLRLAPGEHPFPDDRRLRLVAYGVRAGWREYGWSLRKRVLWALWFAAVAFAPLPLARSTVRLGFQGARRPALLRSLTG